MNGSAPLIGVLGAGQLGRMLALAGYRLGLRFRFFDPSASGCAGQVGELIQGSYDDPEALARFARGVNIFTYEFENVPVAAIKILKGRGPIHPNPRALEIAQDRWTEKNFFLSVNAPTPEFALVADEASLAEAARRIPFPAILKTRRDGYDGKGQARVETPAVLPAAWESIGRREAILERRIPFDREFSIVAVRSMRGEIAFYPLTENVHRDGILRVSAAPSPRATPRLEAQAREAAALLLTELDYVGALAIEFFEVEGGLLLNEMAPRVHNSGHWTIDGAATCQFENHLRAILGLPLGSTATVGASVMLNLIGDVPDAARLLAQPGARAHLYGKDGRPGRKIGHVTFTAPTPDEARALAATAAAALGIELKSEE